MSDQNQLLSVPERLRYLDLRAWIDFAFLIVLAVLPTSLVAGFGWKGLFVVGLIFTLLGFSFRAKNVIDTHFNRGMSESDGVVVEIVESYARSLSSPVDLEVIVDKELREQVGL